MTNSSVRIERVGKDRLDEYCSIPINFKVEREYRIQPIEGGLEGFAVHGRADRRIWILRPDVPAEELLAVEGDGDFAEPADIRRAVQLVDTGRNNRPGAVRRSSACGGGQLPGAARVMVEGLSVLDPELLRTKLLFRHEHPYYAGLFCFSFLLSQIPK